MRWLRTGSVAVALAVPALLLGGCSSDDSSSPGVSLDASPVPPTQFEAGSPCQTTSDCVTGLLCLYQAGACNAFPVCVAAPADPCPSGQTVCSCLGQTTTICGGYADEPVDTTLPLAPCADSGASALPEAGATDAGGDALDAASSADAAPGDGAAG